MLAHVEVLNTTDHHIAAARLVEAHTGAEIPIEPLEPRRGRLLTDVAPGEYALFALIGGQNTQSGAFAIAPGASVSACVREDGGPIAVEFCDAAIYQTDSNGNSRPTGLSTWSKMPAQINEKP